MELMSEVLTAVEPGKNDVLNNSFGEFVGT
jgi:hypothetical protein